MDNRALHDELVGRELSLSRLDEWLRRAADGKRTSVLVTGESGIGKTSLVRASVSAAESRGAVVGWGTCVEGAVAPGYWPWTQAIQSLARSVGAERARDLAGVDAPLLASIASGFGETLPGEAAEQSRFLLMDAVLRWLDALALMRPVVVFIDDLQWADDSSLALVEFVARAPHPEAVCLIGAYRHHELSANHRPRLASIAAHAEHLHVDGISRPAVHRLVAQIVGSEISAEATEEIAQRTAGNPFFVRELALTVVRDAIDPLGVPSAIREAIERRVLRLPPRTMEVLEVSAVAGNVVVPDVVGATLAITSLDFESAISPAIGAGILASAGDGRFRFSHDLFRETLLAGIDAPRRVSLHQRIGDALEDRLRRGGSVQPIELAYHFAAAIAVDGPDRAALWALEAAMHDSSALAFAEGAAHLRRLRAAVADAGAALDDRLLVDVLLAEADALARAGSTLDAGGLLRMARGVADRCAEPSLIARAALALVKLGARFAARRDQMVHELESALHAVTGVDVGLEAQLTAALARELQHSVPEDRHRAAPLSQKALDLSREGGDAATLGACLLARHDVLWSPGHAEERVAVCLEIVTIARQMSDEERQAEGLLLLANAHLELGSAAYLPLLESCLDIVVRLAQPRHRYTLETRRAAVALLTGRLDEAAERIDAGTALGQRIREPDTANVAMSQRLELVHARGDRDELRSFARDAVVHWTGAPVHAHAVAAGFFARAGDLDLTRVHVATVLDLGTWRADRSYLWSVFVRELSRAAVALDDRKLAADLLDDLLPLGTSCGVNGAVVAFAGSHAHTAATLVALLGRSREADSLFDLAAATYRRLGATGWLTELEADRRAHRDRGPGATGPSLRDGGAVWHIRFNGREATVPATKGLADIAMLVSHPGVDIHVLDLVEAADRSGSLGKLVDTRALASYRLRLTELDDDVAEAERHHDIGRVAQLAHERQAILDELGRVTGNTGQSRNFANHPAERARKTVTARVRDAIRHLDPIMAELAAHLDLTIVTGTYCRYRAESAVAWEVELSRDR